MENYEFYSRLSNGLLSQGFYLDPENLSKQDVINSCEPYNSFIRNYIRINNFIEVSFDYDKFKQLLYNTDKVVDRIFFKYKMGQPILLGVVIADHFNKNESIIISKKFDNILLKFKAITSKVKGSYGKLGVLGIILFVFNNHEVFSNFMKDEYSKCKFIHFMKSVFTLPWVFDITNKTIIKHRGVPFLGNAIDIPKVLDVIFT